MEPESTPEAPKQEGSDNASTGKSSTGLDENVAGALCYLLGFITGIAFLVLEKDSSIVRFHAMQSTFTFVGLFVLSIVVRIIPGLSGVLSVLVWLTTLVVWVLLMFKAFQGERYKLPFVGDLVEQQIARS